MESQLRPRITEISNVLLREARALPQTIRREVNARGTRPRAWLGEPRQWTTLKSKRVWFTAGILAYTLIGFILVPWLARREIVAALEKTFERPVTLERMRFNPYALSADLRGFRLNEKDGAPLAGFDRLYLRFQLLSPLHWAWCFDEARLEGASGNIIRDRDGVTNLARLLQALESPAPKLKKDKGLPRVIIDRIEIKNTKATYTDLTMANAFKTEIGPVYVKLNRFSTLSKKQGKQHIFVQTEGGAKLEWTGTFGLNPIMSAGHVTSKGLYMPLIARYLEDQLKIIAPGGHSASALDYQLMTRADGALALKVSNFSLVLSDAVLHQSGAGQPFLKLPELRVAGGHMAWPERTAGAASLTINGLDVTLLRDADGQFALARAGASRKAAAPDPASASTPESQEWSLALDTFELKNARARYDDRSLRVPHPVEISAFVVESSALTNKRGADFPFSLSTDVAPGGNLKVQGHFSVLPHLKIDAKVAAADLQIAAAQPFVHEGAQLKIADGRLNFETDLKMDGPENLAVAGHVELRALKLEDEVDNVPVIAWERVGIERFDYSKSANTLKVSQVTLSAPFLRFFVAKDRSTNFSHIAVAKEKAEMTAGSEMPAPQAQPATANAMNISVGKIVVEKGSADYADESLPLPFAAKITDLQGDVAALASDTTEPARLSLHGQVGEFGEAKIEGALTPFDPTRSTKIDIFFRNVEFPGLSPYTVKFAGQRIANGRLDVTLKYAIDAGKLAGENRVVIRNIELGEKVDVPGAKNLPLGLAIAVLKDREGKIDVNLPVSGDVKDPKFAIGGVIWNAIFNLLTNIVTSPFQALAGLGGGEGSKLDHIAFAPGSPELSPPEKEKIVQLGKALEQRPALGIVVPGAVDPEADRLQLQLNAVDAQMADELGERNAIERQRRFLQSMFKDLIGKDQLEPLEQQFMRAPQGQPDARPELDEAAFVAVLRERVAQAQPIGKAELETLAQARAAVVADALKQAPGLDPLRVTVKGSVETKADEDGAIPLKLEAASLESGP